MLKIIGHFEVGNQNCSGSFMRFYKCHFLTMESFFGNWKFSPKIPTWLYTYDSTKWWVVFKTDGRWKKPHYEHRVIAMISSIVLLVVLFRRTLFETDCTMWISIIANMFRVDQHAALRMWTLDHLSWIRDEWRNVFRSKDLRFSV